jgi:hypothetical protein
MAMTDAINERWESSTPIISLWMPWANWVMLGWKTVETRRHNRFRNLEGKRIGIHATAKWDDTAIEAARPYLSEEQISDTLGFLRIGGAILGTVQVEWASHQPLAAQFCKSALIECVTERYGLYLRFPRIIEAIPARGKQGIWYWRRGDD